MLSIYKKELRSYFTNMTGYISVALILIMTGIFSRIVNFEGGYPAFEYVLPTVSLILLLAVPIITMKSFAEERSLKTDILLYTLPINTTQIVIGKYFAMMTVFALPTAVMSIIPLVLSMYGDVNFLSSYASIIAFYLLCCAMVAICMFMSSLTESQIIAAVLGIAALVVCYASSLIANAVPGTAIASFIAFTVLVLLISLIVYYFVRNLNVSLITGVVIETLLLIFYLKNSNAFAGLFGKFIASVSIFDSFSSFVSNQLIDMTVIVYYTSIAFLFCFLTVQTVEKRRFN